MKYYTPVKISENISETPEGYLVCIGVSIARTGVMEYAQGEVPLEGDDRGIVEIYRDEKQVFNPKTIASFEGKPLTLTHPEEFVTPENWSELAKGIVQNVRRGTGEQKDDLIADILVTDQDAINLVKGGLREVSCGYEADYVQVDDSMGMQRRIIGNHLALVDKGRAGSAYAINDSHHKGAKKMGIKETVKSIFGKAQDEAMKVIDEEMKEDKKEPAKDEKKDGAGIEVVSDAKGMDEIKKMVSDLGEKIEAISGAKGKDADEPAPEKKEEKAGDEGGDMESRLKALEASVSKLLEMMADKNPAGDEKKDDDNWDDDDFDETTMTGDTASRVEILAPGLAMTKDAKLQSLKAAYKTADGKKVIDSLSAGKPDFTKPESVETLFIAASELLKSTRNTEMAGTRKRTEDSSTEDNAPMTAEKMNEINAKFWQQQKH